ncbi:MAG: Na+/H+ antiporter NhaA, partial [Calditrichia bacterium]
MNKEISQHDSGMFQRFFHSEVSGSLFLLGSTIIALIWANSPWADVYFKLSHTKIGVSWGGLNFHMSLEHWIADGLMVIFFFVVGLEIKRELVIGQLSSLKKAILPVAAALGGMIVPAGLYILLNFNTDAISGWGVPMATDIAFALGILALFGSRAPLGLKVFLTALAIVDDLGAILVIALFYSEKIFIGGLILAGIFLLLILLANRMGIRQMWIYLILATGVWAGIMASGIHATVAGVLVAMLVPVKGTISPREFFSRTKKRLDELEDAGLTRDSMVADPLQMNALDDIYFAVEDMRPAGLSLENQLHPLQSFLILPLFALFKAGVSLDAESASHLTGSLSLGIILGLFVGKQIGVLLFSWIAVRSGQTILPDGVTWGQLWGVSILAGVGFTMSIFISDLAFSSATMINEAKLAILIASLLAGVIGYFVLRKVLPAL